MCSNPAMLKREQDNSFLRSMLALMSSLYASQTDGDIHVKSFHRTRSGAGHLWVCPNLPGSKLCL
jgi:hypothetical protein